MKRDGPKNIVASVQARLVDRSRELGVEHQLTLARFGGERLLYRLSKSEFADRFILKGAALLLLWRGDTPTEEEAALLGACLVASIDHGPLSPSALVARTIASTRATFMPASYSVSVDLGESRAPPVARHSALRRPLWRRG